MNKIIYTLFCLAWFLPGLAQDPKTNLQKYWNMRERLKKYFIANSSNNEKGTNIPALGVLYSRWGVGVEDHDGDGNINYVVNPGNPGLAGGNPANPDLTGHYHNDLYFSDGNAQMQEYIGVLATEYRLLQIYGQDFSGTRDELYNALRALERLDRNAELYWGASASLNGFFIRDDVDDSVRDINPVFQKYNLIESTYMSHVYGGPLNDENPCPPGYPHPMSHDNVWNYLPQLALVKVLVDDQQLKQMAIDIAARMIRASQIEENGNQCWILKDPNGNINCEGAIMDEASSCNIYNYHANPGKLWANVLDWINESEDITYNFTGLDYGFAEAGKWMTDPDGDGPLQGEDFHWGGSEDHLSQYERVMRWGGHNDSYINTAILFDPEILSGSNHDDFGKVMEHTIGPSIDLAASPGMQPAPGEGNPWMALVYAILHGHSVEMNPDVLTFEPYLRGLLNLCPTCGPYNFGPDISNFGMSPSPIEWTSMDRFTWPNSIMKSGENLGFYAGLDYMLMHNLYFLVFGPHVYSAEHSICPDFADGVYMGYVGNVTINCGLNVGNSASVYADDINLKPGFSARATEGGAIVLFSHNYINRPIYSKRDHFQCTIPLIDNPIYRSSSHELYDYKEEQFLNDRKEIDDVQPEKNEGVSVYPNPTNGLLTIRIPEANQNTTLMIYNFMGQVVYDGQVKDQLSTVDMSDFSDGVYLVKVTTSVRIETFEVVKQ